VRKIELEISPGIFQMAEYLQNLGVARSLDFWLSIASPEYKMFDQHQASRQNGFSDSHPLIRFLCALKETGESLLVDDGTARERDSDEASILHAKRKARGEFRKCLRFLRMPFDREMQSASELLWQILSVHACRRLQFVRRCRTCNDWFRARRNDHVSHTTKCRQEWDNNNLDTKARTLKNRRMNYQSKNKMHAARAKQCSSDGDTRPKVGPALTPGATVPKSNTKPQPSPKS
jgi:hypothetical protein